MRPCHLAACCGLALLAGAGGAAAHGLAGNRYFPGTLAIDDPAVGDDLAFPNLTLAPTAPDGPRDLIGNLTFSRLLTERISLGFDTGATERSAPNTPARSGWNSTNITLKWKLLEDDPGEMLASASLIWGFGGSGNRSVGAGGPTTLQPGVFIGKGLGWLPEEAAWLRPFAVTAAFGVAVPLQGQSVYDASTPQGPQLTPTLGRNATVLNWGFSVQYSTYYLTDRFTGGPPAEEPLFQFVPLVEFAFSNTLGPDSTQRTQASANPGLAYVGATWQVAAEAIVPLNRGAGHGIGGRVQLLMFLDDLVPAVFDRPVFGR